MGKIKDGFYFGIRAVTSSKKFLKKKSLFVGRQCSAINYFEGKKIKTIENLLFLDFTIDIEDFHNLRLLESNGNILDYWFESFAWKHEIETWLVFK